jgi:hypothetical protein
MLGDLFTRKSRLGANSFIMKPTEIEKTLEIAYLLKGWWLGFNHFAPIEIAPPIAGTSHPQKESPSPRSPSLELVGSSMANSAAGRTG